MRIIGLDVGEKRIGVAKVDSSTRIAIPVGTISVDGSEWQEIARIARVNSTNFFVLGLPRSNEGNETAQTLYVRNFAKILASKVPDAKIRFQDESLTSVEAEKRLKSRKKSYEKGEIDAEAASIILQDFIETFREKPSKNPQNNVKSSKTTAIIEKEAEKAMLKTKKATNKLRNSMIAVIAAILLAGGAVWGVVAIKDYRAKKRAEEYARIEAEMKAETFNFTIVPGDTIFTIKDKLIKAGYSAKDADDALSATYDVPILSKKPATASLEGYLYGETYEFYKEDPATKVIETFLKETDQIFTENNFEARFAAHGLSVHEGITLASIIQKEAVPGAEPTVAQIIYSRLGYGWRLGVDSANTYALDLVDPDRTTYKDNAAALNLDSCYNTRIYTGLPCGPISNPGLAALEAVANPSDSSYLYFLTGDDGLMYYSYTESEHLQKAATYCRERCNIAL